MTLRGRGSLWGLVLQLEKIPGPPPLLGTGDQHFNWRKMRMVSSSLRMVHSAWFHEKPTLSSISVVCCSLLPVAGMLDYSLGLKDLFGLTSLARKQINHV